MDLNEEVSKLIREKFTQIKVLSISDRPFVEILRYDPPMIQCRCMNPAHHANVKKQLYGFTTLTAAGIKQEGMEFAYHFTNEQDAIDGYLKELEKFLKENIKGDCQLVWRKYPEIVKIPHDYRWGYKEGNKFYIPQIFQLFNAVSRLAIVPEVYGA